MSTAGASLSLQPDPSTAPCTCNRQLDLTPSSLLTMRLSPRRSLALCFAFVLPTVFADVEFTSPARGAVMPVGVLNVAWKESGKQPYIQELAAYTLNLMVGGNDPLQVNNSIAIFTLVSGGTFNNNSVSVAIPPSISATVANGFYLEMSCSDRNSGVLIDYSDRFTLTNMTGTVPGTVLNAALQLHDNPAGPNRGGNVPALRSAQPSGPTTSPSSSPHTQTRSGASSASSSTSSPSVPTTYHAPLGMGAIAGIVIAALIGATVLLAGIIFLLFRRRRRKLHDGVIDTSDPSAFGKRPPASWKQPSVTTLSELSADGRIMEMGDGMPPPEMDSMNVRAELEGDPLPRPGPLQMRQDSMGSSFYDRPQTPLTPIAPSIYEGTLIGPVDYLGSPVTPMSGV